MKKISKLSSITVGYSLLTLLWFISWLLARDENWWLVLVNRGVPYIFIPTLLLAVWTVYVRQPKRLVPLFVPVVIFAILYYPYIFPKIAQSTDGSNSLKVMTYNVLFSNYDYAAVANVVLTYKPDLVALQEVQPEMMSELEERLKEEYPFSLLGTPNDYGTTAVFSRHPISEAYVLDLQVDRPAVVVKTKINGQEITFVSVHLLAYNLWWTKLKDIPATVMERTFNQNRQANLILGESRIQKGIVLIGCDCNSYETSRSYRILNARLKNSAREVGWALGNDVLPGTKQDVYLQHIDYVWYSGFINPINVFKITDSGGSDHLPVLAVFEIE
ncbi:MAG: endonuclease/exonuclease/phosphatase family protein [Anaerolineales bacterium]|nr:endonuclease/exonuclease/phosphatase family protein [Anaerolineales bacterium]HNQ94376.1 endonuclease/exonuclease/phosphatase family protein [Anaerolineales bacterium]